MDGADAIKRIEIDYTEMTDLEQAIVRMVLSVDKGHIATYKEVAMLAGYPNCARQVSRILRKYSEQYALPWHRILGSGYKIRLKKFLGFELQKSLLESEGFRVTDSGNVKKV